MRFIEMTGDTLREIVADDELSVRDLDTAHIGPRTIVRVNEQGDIEVRRRDTWDVVGGLLGNFAERIRRRTGLDYA